MNRNHPRARRIAALACAAALLCAGALPCRAESAAERLLGEMTLEQKVGQLFIVRPEYLDAATGTEAEDADAPTRLTSAMRDGLAARPVGGVAIFGRNIQSPDQLRALIADLQGASAVPLFIAVDEEGGPVARLANAEGFGLPQVGAMERVGATGDPQSARDAYRTIGAYLADYGFNLDFAPVADVNTNPDNIVIGKRAFGSDPALVAQMVPAALEGLHASGVLGCLKHFPGHGDTSDDTHDGYVATAKSWDEMKRCELVPFVAALGSADLVMAAHITTPNVTSDGLSASLSREMIDGKLRGELGYDGVVITDALDMGAITSAYAPGEAAVLALQAGADILLLPESLPEAFDGVLSAVQSGAITPERLNESVLRILRLKEKLNLIP